MFKYLFKNRRWIKFIDPKQQTRLALEIVLLVLLFPVLFYILTVSELWSTIFFGDQAEVMRNLFYSQLMLMTKAWHVILLIVLFIAFLSVFFTHKLFGPIYRFTQALEEKMEGQKDIYADIRKGDYFEEFAQLVKRITRDDVELKVPHEPTDTQR
jgi:hypothetical protein